MKISFGEALFTAVVLYSAAKVIYKNETYYKPLCGQQDSRTCKLLEEEDYIYKLQRENGRIKKVEEYPKTNLTERINEIIPEEQLLSPTL